MNCSRAKKIRKQIYGDLSKRVQQYGLIKRVKRVLARTAQGLLVRDDKGIAQRIDKLTKQLICVGPRAQYKMAKAAWKMQNAGLVPWVKSGHWCKGTWRDYLAGLYAKSKIRFQPA